MAYGDALKSTDDLKGRDSIDLLARMLYSEAGNQTEKGKRGCAYVAKNRKDKDKKEFGGMGCHRRPYILPDYGILKHDGGHPFTFNQLMGALRIYLLEFISFRFRIH